MAKIGMTSENAVAGSARPPIARSRNTANPRVKLAAFQGDHDVWVIIAKAADIATLAATAEREARDLLTAVS